MKNSNLFLLAFFAAACLEKDLFVLGQENEEPQGIPVAGGMTATRPADASSQAVANQVMGTVEGLFGRIFTLFAVQSYRTQVVAGTNYYLKVMIQDTENGQYVAHIRVFKPIHGDVALTGLLFPKMWSDPITLDGYEAVTSGDGGNE